MRRLFRLPVVVTIVVSSFLGTLSYSSVRFYRRAVSAEHFDALHRSELSAIQRAQATRTVELEARLSALEADLEALRAALPGDTDPAVLARLGAQLAALEAEDAALRGELATRATSTPPSTIRSSPTTRPSPPAAPTTTTTAPASPCLVQLVICVLGTPSLSPTTTTTVHGHGKSSVRHP